MLGKRNRWTSAARVAIFAGLIAWPMATACSGSSGGGPAGSGDDVINDTRDSSVRAPANPDPGDDAGPDAQNTGPSYYNEAGPYPGLAECGNCTCAADKYYCFGGATPRTSIAFPGAAPLAATDAAAGDGGLPACPVVDASTPQLGCNPLPSACPPSSTTCACVINLLQASYSCILQCASNGAGQPMTAYCPYY